MSRHCRRESNTIVVRNALIEEIFRDRNTGYVTISYGEMGAYNMIHMNVVTLVVNQCTVMQNALGQELRFRDLEKGMTVNVEFSNAMTASIPPQTRAFQIIVVSRNRSPYVKVGRVVLVDVDNNYLVTGRAEDINSQIRYNVTPMTVILDKRGRRTSLRHIRPGQIVEIEHAPNMTFSIPPQTQAYRIQIL